MKHPISNLLDYCTSHDWAMRLSVMESMSGIIERHVKGQHLTEAEINAITAETHAACPDHRRIRAVFSSNPSMAVIDISGVIAKHADMVNDISQPRGTSIETLRDEFSKAMADDKIESIFLNIESPGGSIDGLADFASEIFEASFKKPIVAFADDLCASAAYWMASQANIVYASQTSDIGSIGVYTLYVDSTERAKTEGLKFHIFRSGIHKGVGSAGIEITEENQEAIQERIDAKFEIFFDAIMRGRAEAGLTENELREIADGRCFVGEAALDNKLVDAIMTIPQALAAPLPAVRNKNEAA
ncbi:MAG: S49 family peptidase, partial [Candidatus Zixiibacteriota bacterium]